MNKYRITNHTTKEEIIIEANSAQEAAQKVGYHIKEVSVIDIGQPKLEGMRLERAIEINISLLGGTYDHRDKEMGDALKLGIEALKYRLELEQTNPEIILEPLQGETED